MMKSIENQPSNRIWRGFEFKKKDNRYIFLPNSNTQVIGQRINQVTVTDLTSDYGAIVSISPTMLIQDDGTDKQNKFYQLAVGVKKPVSKMGEVLVRLNDGNPPKGSKEKPKFLLFQNSSLNVIRISEGTNVFIDADSSDEIQWGTPEWDKMEEKRIQQAKNRGKYYTDKVLKLR
jgi:hypothetical protein